MTATLGGPPRPRNMTRYYAYGVRIPRWLFRLLYGTDRFRFKSGPL